MCILLQITYMYICTYKHSKKENLKIIRWNYLTQLTEFSYFTLKRHFMLSITIEYALLFFKFCNSLLVIQSDLKFISVSFNNYMEVFVEICLVNFQPPWYHSVPVFSDCKNRIVLFLKSKIPLFLLV